MTRIKVDEWSGAKQITVPAELVTVFAELVQRGANLWPDAPASIKEFADIVTHGKAMQDYSKPSATNQPPERLKEIRENLAQQHVNSGD